MSSNEAIKKIPEAVAGLVKKITDTANQAVTDIEAKGEETIAKIGRVVEVTKKPLIECDALLDELLGGDNGGPALHAVGEVADTAATFQNTIAGVPAGNKPSISASQPSQLGKPTGGITASDVAKANG